MKLFYLIRAWLTLSRRCAWCQPKRTLRRAPFHRGFTDGICRDCDRKVRLSLVRPVRGELADAPAQRPGFLAKHLWRILT